MTELLNQYFGHPSGARMALQLVGKPKQIADAINAFPAEYHDGFAKVRAIGRLYITERTPSESTVLELAKHLRDVLIT